MQRVTPQVVESTVQFRACVVARCEQALGVDSDRVDTVRSVEKNHIAKY